MKSQNQKGFTVVEVMIAVLVLGLVLLAWMSLESFTAQTVRRVSDFSAGQRVMVAIMTDILSAEKGLPAIEPVVGTFDDVAMTRAQLEGDFEKNTNRKTICYDRNAVLTAVAQSCYYGVSYFKIRLKDRTFGTSDLANIPLARVIVRIRYKDMNEKVNQDPDPSKHQFKTRYLTRLVSNVADF